MPIPQLLNAQRALLARVGAFPFRVTVDGVVLDRSPLESVRAGSARGVRLLAGSNHDESSFFVRGSALERPIDRREIQNATMDHMQAMEPKYKALFPQLTDAQRKIRLLTAEEYWIPTLRVAEAHTAAGGETWLYRFDYPRLRGPLAGEVPHTQELSFVWGDTNGDAGHDALMRSVHAVWVDFIFGRALSLADAPVWPRFNLAARPVMLIGRKSTVALDPDSTERRLWYGWPA
jgi:para-nitrobenzyl esterase